MPETLLSVRDLSISIKLERSTLKAVKSASFDIARGETLVLAGESGSGKTIACRGIAQILPAAAHIDSGEVIFEGLPLTALKEEELRHIRGKKISYIFQEPASYLNPLFTIGDQIMEPLLVNQAMRKPQALQEAESLLTQVHFKEPQRILKSYPHQLSGGMNQRAFLAMSLASRPNLLIADEPTTSLDVTIEAAILELLTRLKENFGFSLLFITHNLAIAKKIADRIAVMYQGQIVECAAKAEIFDCPRHFHTQQLIKAYEKIGRIQDPHAR